MISKVSWFNYGIYKNTLKRFKWGAVLYTIILFFSAPFVIMTEKGYYGYNGVEENDSLFVAIFAAMVVPTVVAMLIYRFAHSKNASLFMTSMPVKKEAIYLSSLFAAFTMMSVPVLVNAVILTVMRFTFYSELIRLAHIAFWTGVNLYVLAVMFAIATFSAFLTGNTPAVAVINLLLITFPFIVYLSVNVIGEAFLKGFTGYSVLEDILKLSPIPWIGENLFDYDSARLSFFAILRTWLYFAAAVLLYVISGFLYKIRRTELCGEVAGFAVMKPILKYTVTTTAFLVLFSILSEIGAPMLFAAATMVVITYFACEMIMEKRINIFAGSIKGLLAYAAVMAAVISFCAFTSFFGYETYVPDINDIKCVAIDGMIYNREADEYMSETDIIDMVRDTHADIINDDDENRENNYYVFDIEYILKDGKSVRREYKLSNEKRDIYIGRLFEETDYKYYYTGMDMLNIDNIKVVNVETYAQDEDGLTMMSSSDILSGDKARELILRTKEDLAQVSYSDFSDADESATYVLRIDNNYSPNISSKDAVFKSYPDSGYDSFSIAINEKFKRAVKYLSECGISE